MQFSELSAELQSKLEDGHDFVARHSSLVDGHNAVDHTIRLAITEDIALVVKAFAAQGYTNSSAKEWFEFSTKHMSPEEATHFAEESAKS